MNPLDQIIEALNDSGYLFKKLNPSPLDATTVLAVKESDPEDFIQIVFRDHSLYLHYRIEDRSYGIKINSNSRIEDFKTILLDALRRKDL